MKKYQLVIGIGLLLVAPFAYAQIIDQSEAVQTAIPSIVKSLTMSSSTPILYSNAISDGVTLDTLYSLKASDMREGKVEAKLDKIILLLKQIAAKK